MHAPSGTGKSTLAAALCKAGCTFFSDGISEVRTDTQGQAVVLPDGRQHRLWADSVEHLDLGERQGETVRAQWPKFHVEPVSQGAAESAPLRVVVVLRQAGSVQSSGLATLALPDAIALLRNDVFRSRLASRLGCDARLFAQIASLIPRVEIVRLNRHPQFYRLDEHVQSLLKHLRCSSLNICAAQ